ncbi:ML domain-containing protein [Streptacidiphilus sp. P02-A3a]|uniref:ML domain-containing protein n=1 Tax=Streptacidiphilus sp. P02-A3a TaxID=2704468 RepID=UPI0015FDBAF6|nr:ML domain-containing protein [Streptacidiphilus sp. P02-A3a]QMU68147.1 hypothetical protein GXP74_07840 [Streptacidiphilus sp. P02-A3a]
MTTTSTGNADWASAGTASDPFTVTSVSFDPQPPVKGQSLTVTLNGTLNQNLTGGQVHITAKYGLVTVFRRSSPLVAAQPGNYTAQAVLDITSDSPSGTYNVNLTLTDQDNQEIAGVNARFSLT